ncbi:MAG: 4Fe-4S binding protein [Kofleriaceae bacterium]|jgi:Ni,Fe-hydrogenase III small subunit/Pyruvate/2-oxoacid:ferredoxin oxidoreductase delta subunit|nr:4Fe-4S binding protein [Kofleriaceae bacterium]MBP9170049.1 4Fe-4S binding protein [Kofleriaceae bacterium]MBP9858250.1 4Fe-4S binding protein [Kofleriaceae bacterium]
MWKLLQLRREQGRQAIPELSTARPEGFRGRPMIATTPCADGCAACVASCPTAAITAPPVRLDLGACTFCGACAEVCPTGKVTFTSEVAMAASQRADLVRGEGDTAAPAIDLGAEIRARFGRSLKLRQVSAGGCNACELELNALANVNFDLGRHGLEWVASPRHADALVVSGPITKTMADAIVLAWDAMTAPRFVVAVGACAVSGGLYRDAAGVDRGFFERVPPLLYVPGCPPHPLTIARALLTAIGVG